MAKIMDKKTDTYKGEKKVFECIESNLPNDIIGYYNREIKGQEFDFCLLIKDFGALIIEVKGWTADSIISVKSPDRIVISGYSDEQSSPKKQARAYRFNLVNVLNEKFKINPCVLDMVCYPFITEKEYNSVGLNIVSEPELTLFKEDIEDKTMFTKKILKVFRNSVKSYSDKMNSDNLKLVRSFFENDIVNSEEDNIPVYSKVLIYPDSITLAEIDELLKEYSKGTKVILFVSNEEYINTINMNISSLFKQKNICFKNGKFVLNSNEESIYRNNNNMISLFNFEVYCINNLKSIISDRVVLTNGVIDDDLDKKMVNISKLCSFNYEQFKVEHADVKSDIMVRAGAGTGKTYSMISRISYICNRTSNSNVIDPSEEIAMMTFTNEAATNMKNRLKTQFMNYYALTKNENYLEMIGNVERMRISTIHSFARDIIQKTTLPLGIGTDFTTTSGNYRRNVILKRVLGEYLEKQILKNDKLFFNIPIDAYKIEDIILEFIKKVYEKGYDIKTASLDMFGSAPVDMPYVNKIIEEVIKKSEIEYSLELKNNNSVDLLEYMHYLNTCITDNSFNKNNYTFKYMFIDEFQDVDDSQIRAFLNMQGKIGFKFFIVGDLKQSIYRFRGATMDAFTKMGCLDKIKWKAFSLTTNYRTDSRLLEKFDRIFSRMGADDYIPYSVYDKLVGVKNNDISDEDLLVENKCSSEDKKNGILYDQLFEIVNKRKSEIEDTLKTKNLTFPEKTIAILVRKNSQIKEVIREGKNRGILVESDSNGNLYKLQSTIDLCKLTSALCNPYNAIYLFDLIMSNNVHVVFNPNSLVNKSADEKRNILISCLDTYYMQYLGKTWNEIIYDSQNKPILKVLRDIYEGTKPWIKYSKNYNQQIHYRINYELLFEDLSRMNKRSFLTLNSINESLEISISTGLEKKSRDVLENNDYVKIICTTVHKSKGLEYDTVILPETSIRIDELKRNSIEVNGKDDKIGYFIDFNRKSIMNEYFIKDNETKEIAMEESRILYVALTRAINKFVWFNQEKKKSVLSWAKLMEEDNYEC